MIENPIIYFEDNLVFNKDKSCWGVYELGGFDYEMLSNEDKVSILHTLTRFLCSINFEAKILIVPIKQNIKEHYSNLRKSIKGSQYDEKMFIVNETEKYLVQYGEQEVNDYKTFICIRLINSDEIEFGGQLQKAYEYFIKNPITAINVFMNIGKYDILKSKVDEFKRISKKFLINNNNRVDLTSVSTATTQWLLRRPSFRGLKKDVKLYYKSVTEDWRPYAQDIVLHNEKIVRPSYKDTVKLFTGSIEQGKRHLKIDNDNGNVSYQSFLSITNVPDYIFFPSGEWIYNLQKQNSQAEICINISNIEHRKAIRQVEFKRREVNSQFENIQEAETDAPDDLYESKDSTSQLEQELKAGSMPLSNVAITICVSGDNVEEVERKALEIKNDYEDKHFIVERPIADQLKLFYSFYPSVNFTVKDFVITTTPTVIASGIFGTTNMLGDNKGMYIGTTGVNQKQVFLSMGEANLNNKSSCATFFGNLGYGKSFNANLFIFHNFVQGGYNLIFDPKGERTHWKNFSLFKDDIAIVTLDATDEYIGTLDPFNVFKEDIGQASNLALNIVCELFKLNHRDNEYLAMLEALNRMKKLENRKLSMYLLCNVLENFDVNDDLKVPAEKLARQLKLLTNAGMGSLIFGDGTERAISFKEKLNILQIQNLTLPSPETEKSDYTQDEVMSNVLMMIMGSFCKKFALQKKNEYSLILFDESWMLGNTVEGAKLYSYLTRMSRSLYCGCIFNGHSVLDIPTEGVKNTITYKFCFNTQNTKEAERMLEYVGLDITENNILMIKNLRNAECLFKDAYGRIGILKFDAVFSDIIELFSTTPKVDN